MSINKLDFVTKNYIVTKEILEQNFAQYKTKRRVRTSQVKNLVKVLKNNGSFPTMYVNRGNNTKMKFLDGNHRFEALLKFFELEPEAKVEIKVGIYDIDDPELERQKFLDLNNIVKPSTDDVIQQYKDDCIFLKKILKNIREISIYGSAGSPLKIRVLIAAYIQATKQSFSPGAINGQTMVKTMDSYTHQDFLNIKGFLKEYQEIFGALTKDSLWIKTTIFTVMFRLWFQNKSRMNHNQMQSKFRTLINNPYVIEHSRLGGRESCLMAADRFVDVMNRARGSGTFVVESND